MRVPAGSAAGGERHLLNGEIGSGHLARRRQPECGRSGRMIGHPTTEVGDLALVAERLQKFGQLFRLPLAPAPGEARGLVRCRLQRHVATERSACEHGCAEDSRARRRQSDRCGHDRHQRGCRDDQKLAHLVTPFFVVRCWPCASLATVLRHSVVWRGRRRRRRARNRSPQENRLPRPASGTCPARPPGSGSTAMSRPDGSRPRSRVPVETPPACSWPRSPAPRARSSDGVGSRPLPVGAARCGRRAYGRRSRLRRGKARSRRSKEPLKDRATFVIRCGIPDSWFA